MTKRVYEKYIKGKLEQSSVSGFEAGELNSHLFDYQKDLVRWALRRGRAAIFADTGLGKTIMQVEWAHQVCKETGGRVLILAPLAVAHQTVGEAAKSGIEITYARQDTGEDILISNYEMLEAFDISAFAGIVLDESSILKSFNGKTRTALIEAFKDTPYRLACTATPSPNDYTELGNHTEFLGIKNRTEMLAEYFVHDLQHTQDWRLKGHAVSDFWTWVATWGAVLKNPADLGYDGSKFKLPELRMHEIVIDIDNTDAWKEGELFALEVRTLSDQRATRRATMEKRVSKIAEIEAAGDGQLLVWGELNDECDLIHKTIGGVQVKGADDPEKKSDHLLGFASGKYNILTTKAKIAGFGMNWQKCNRMIFVGASHSFEQTYQAIRRCWRFGQKKPVDVYILRASTEQGIIDNYKKKEKNAEVMSKEMASKIAGILTSEIRGTKREWNEYKPSKKMAIPTWIGEEI